MKVEINITHLYPDTPIHQIVVLTPLVGSAQTAGTLGVSRVPGACVRQHCLVIDQPDPGKPHIDSCLLTDKPHFYNSLMTLTNHTLINLFFVL